MEKINHLVVLMMENRSFDHVLGALTLLHGRSDVAGISELQSNPGPDGKPVVQWCMDDAPCTYNVPHLLDDVAAQYDKGAMDGFITRYCEQKSTPVDPRVPMGYYTEKTFPVLYALASRFTVCDAWFSSVLSSTWPNRKYFHSGTRDEDDDTQILPWFPGFKTTPLYQAVETTRCLKTADRFLTWRSYFSDLPFLSFWYGFAATHHTNFSSVVQFAEDCAAGTLPHISIIDPPYGIADDHPPHDPKLGEKFIGLVVDALTTSQSWDDTALLILFDEHGGFYDHVKPESPTVENRWKDSPYGFRVPALIVSPFTAKGECSHITYDHTSFMKTVHERWGVDFPPNTYDIRWQHANSIWPAFKDDGSPLPRGIYTGITNKSEVATLNWATGIYERLKDDVTRFENYLDRIFVLPELKALDQRATVFDTLDRFEHAVVTQKRMHDASNPQPPPT